MTSRVVDDLLAAQHDCVATWQLVVAGWSEKAVRCRLRAAGLRRVDRIDGVWTTSRAPLTPVQRWRAATLSAPGTCLAGISAALHDGFGDLRGPEAFVVVARVGSRAGPKRIGGLLVCRARALRVATDGIPRTTAAQTLVDLAPHLGDLALRRAVLEALRLRRTTIPEIAALLPRRRAAPRLRAILDAVADLPVARCRSNAEATALVRLKAAGRSIPAVNEVVAGYEADQVDEERKVITEIDGGAFHVDPEEDAKRTLAWSAKGFRVERRPSDDAYDTDAAW